MVRKFWLINSKGDKFDITSKNSKLFLYAPMGLGFIKDIDTLRRGNSTEVRAIQYEMPVISGELLFSESLSGMYQDYQNFIQFAKHRPLKLYYQTPNTFDSWYVDCEIASLEKGDVNFEDRLLHCPISFLATSFWQTAKEYDLAVEEQIVGGKIYPYTYPFTYEGNSFAHIDLISSGTLESGFRFEINDIVTNPTLSLYQNDEKYGEIKILGTYDMIKVDTRDGKESLYLEYQGSAIANPTSYFDLSSNGQYETPFPKLRVGDNVLTFSYGGVFTSAIHIKWQDLFSTI